jgi:hypothetical protein
VTLAFAAQAVDCPEIWEANGRAKAHCSGQSNHPGNAPRVFVDAGLRRHDENNFSCDRALK